MNLTRLFVRNTAVYTMIITMNNPKNSLLFKTGKQTTI